MCQAGAQPPPNPAVGDVYFNTVHSCMYIWVGANWTQLTGQHEWVLFLDDEREPPDANFFPPQGANLLVARTVDEAQRLVSENGLPTQISFDHDLGEGQEVATKFMWWLINGHLDEHWNCNNITMVRIHSANIKGAENLHLLWEGFCKTHGIVCEIRRVKAIQK
jgi:hypothetical protein